MKYKHVILGLLVLFSVLNVCMGAPDSFDETGQDIGVVLTSIFEWAYDIVIIVMFGLTIISALYILKDHTSSGTDGKSGSSGIKLAKGIILATVVLVAVPFFINMILGS